VRAYDDGQPIGAAGHDALITAWRFLAAQLDGQPGDEFQLPEITVTVENGEVRVAQDGLQALIIALAGIANAQLLVNAALVLGEDTGDEAERAWARSLIEGAIAEQTLDAHATDLDG
jgi:hypothetical protein